MAYCCGRTLNKTRVKIRFVNVKRTEPRKEKNEMQRKDVLSTDLAKVFQNLQRASGSGNQKQTQRTTAERIEFKFDIGLRYEDIKSMLGSRPGFNISERHLKRLLSASREF